MRWLLLALPILAGCDHLPKRVEVPVAVTCAAGLPATRFTPYSKAELDRMNDGQWVDAVWLDRDLSARYVASLEGIVLACSTLPR